MILKKSKLMNNAIFIKICKCLKKDIKLSSLQWLDQEAIICCQNETHTTKNVLYNLLATEMKRTQILLKKTSLSNLFKIRNQ